MAIWSRQFSDDGAVFGRLAMAIIEGRFSRRVSSSAHTVVLDWIVVLGSARTRDYQLVTRTTFLVYRTVHSYLYGILLLQSHSRLGAFHFIHFSTRVEILSDNDRYRHLSSSGLRSKPPQ